METTGLVDVMTLPDHLKPIEPAAAAHAVCERIATEAPGYQHGVAAKFYAFMETRAPRDGRRLAHALRHVLKRPDLAAEVEALLPPVPRPPDLDGILHMQSSGRWAIWQSDREPIEISCGELFHVEVEGLKGGCSRPAWSTPTGAVTTHWPATHFATVCMPPWVTEIDRLC